MEFKELVLARFNAKKFKDKKVDDVKLSELFDIIRFAPSADNLQPWKIKAISDPVIKEKLMPAIMPFNQERVAMCSHLLVFCADTDLESHWTKLEGDMKAAGIPEEEIAHMAQVATMIFNRSPEEKLERSRWDVFLAVCNAVNGAKSLGFDSSLMGGFNAKEFARLLELPSNLVPTLMVAIGYASERPMKKVRFTKEDVFF
jgi:nitroreductase / dihydropteridine reductase